MDSDPISLVRSFRCLQDDPDATIELVARCLYGSGDDAITLNALTWYAGEEVCRAYAVKAR